MASFDLSTTKMTPDARADAFGEGVVWSLTRPFDVITQARPLPAFVEGVYTLGLVPAITFPKSWSDFLYMERDQFEMMINWLDGTRPGDARRREFPWQRPRLTRSFWSALLIPVVLLVIVLLLWCHWWVSAGIVWNVALTGLFFSLAQQIRHTHRADVRWVVRRVHLAARDAGVSVHLVEPDGKLSIERHWFIVGLAMAVIGQPWGMAYALAGQLRRRAVAEDGPAVRLALARACREIYLVRNPGAVAPGPERLANG